MAIEDQIKSLPKKYIQYTDENRKDRRKAYVALDEVLEIVNRQDVEYGMCKNPLHNIPHDELGGLTFHEYEDMREKALLNYSEVTYNDIVPGTAILSEEALERAKELENNQE